MLLRAVGRAVVGDQRLRRRCRLRSRKPCALRDAGRERLGLVEAGHEDGQLDVAALGLGDGGSHGIRGQGPGQDSARVSRREASRCDCVRRRAAFMLRRAAIMPSVAPNAQYNVAAADSLPVKIAAHQRRKMFARFLADFGASADDTVLDVGATSERTYEASNYLEAWYPHKDKVTALGLDDASFLPTLYPGMRFVQADALALPFADAAFDIVHAAAVIEHVGAFERQSGLLRECSRVARRAVFVTTPNRWFPIEFHTVLPVVHWLPKPLCPRPHAPHRTRLFRG